VPALAAIGIVTGDLDESVRFYRLLGVDVPDPDWTEPAGQRVSLAFECTSPAEVDRLHRRVVNGGFRSKKDPWDAFWGQRYAQVIDPDDNVVDLFAPLPNPTA
jgi:uncharacterized glyoxalase superfamily protein PhnB